ncbi:RNA polymerase sigma factor [Chitinophaga solisilvae]|uniref:RNA polymerase sigma factor n=1 Tax=Chitinophaga solisilvae TaxID=1233460 RepID=UPI00136FFD26|nr:sigma-70 family RNA polymerase sigma factor [Chitinophaga solisilvae]
MEAHPIIPHLFKTEYRKIAAVLFRRFGFDHFETAEDIVSDTFLSATETWQRQGLPDNPVAWLYTVAGNKAKNLLKHQQVVTRNAAANAGHETTEEMPEIDLSPENIRDSQLQMMFTVCHPAIPAEAQIGLALRLLCGFSITEIADAFLTSKETINKRLLRGKDKLREANIAIQFPGPDETGRRLEIVLRTLYLLFNEGYYSASHNTPLRRELCFEAMRLTQLLTENAATNQPPVNALLALMCFQASRFDARTSSSGDTILYSDQDTSLWNDTLIAQGEHYLQYSSQGDQLTRYHLEAGIAYWHTIRQDTPDKWQQILQLYNHLLQLEYSPIAALNRTYVLSRVHGKAKAIAEAEKLQLNGHHLYHTLLGELYTGTDNHQALQHFEKAMMLCSAPADKKLIAAKMLRCR